MQPPYELVYGYQHCVGRTLYIAGAADTIEEARLWAHGGGFERVAPPAEDPLCWCPVSHCHMKRQLPWFGYRSADGTLTIAPPASGGRDPQERHGAQGKKST